MSNHPDYSQLKIKPSDLLRHRHRRHPATTGEACGCCPACGELVVIEAIDPGMASTCPHCGSSFGHLIPLGETGEETGRS